MKEETFTKTEGTININWKSLDVTPDVAKAIFREIREVMEKYEIAVYDINVK